MQIQQINNTNFNGHIKRTPTYQNLLETADEKVKAMSLDIIEAIKQKDDSLVYTFANSKSKRNGNDYFHLSLIEEDTRSFGYSVVRQTIEIPGEYASIVDACTKNKNLLEKFIKFFSNKYEAQLNNKILDYEKINDVYEIKKDLF